MKRIAYASVALIGGALWLTGGAAHAVTGPVTNLVTNGSFEQGSGGIGSFAGWQTMLGDAATFVDSSGQTGPHAGQASEGLWSAYFGSTAAHGGSTIQQSLATTAGQSYLLSIDLANDVAGGNGFTLRLNGATVLSASNLAAQDYATRQLTFTASGGSTLLAISAYNDAGYLQFDRLVVTAVPEPASGLLLAAGLLALRRRRSA